MNDKVECEHIECPVCFETVKLEKLHCNHSICKSCKIKINKINSRCPLCRVNFTIKNLSGNINYSLYGNGYQVTPEKYLPTFYENCLNQNHKIIISKPYGVLLTCSDCGKKKSYNWLN